MSNPDQALGQIVVRNLLATQDDLRRCLELQAAERARGRSPRALGEILVAEGVITRRQLEAVLEEQTRRGGGTQRLGPYEIQARLGEGGMGVVYKGRDPRTNLSVALKVLARRFAENPSFLGRFRREAAIGQKLDHPHVVRTLAFGEDRGNHYIALELMEGGDLARRLKADKVLEERPALEIIRAVALALQYAHERGLVHRDVKPSNIMFTAQGAVKLSDFGLVKSSDPEASQLTLTGAALGTPHYIAPEQALGEKDVDVRADLYSLGATLYHLVTGRPPFEGATPIEVIQKHLDQQLTPPDEIAPTLSDGCVTLIERLMAKDKADRYPTPAEAAADVDRVLRGEEPVTAAIDEARSSLKVSARRREKVRRRLGAGTHRMAIVRPGRSVSSAQVAGGIALAGVGIIVLLVTLLSGREPAPPAAPPSPVGRPKPPPRPEPAPPPAAPSAPAPAAPSEDEARKAYARLSRFEGLRPDDRATRARRLEEFIRQYDGTFAAAEARALLNSLRVPDGPPKPAEKPPAPAPLDASRLRPGLVATYGRFEPLPPSGTPGPARASALLRRVDASIDWNWREEAPHASVPADGFLVQWQGRLRVEQAGLYTFALEADDGVRLRVGGRRLIERWATQPAARSEGSIELERGFHDLELDYFENLQGARCRLLWSLKGGFTERAVPPEALWHDPAAMVELAPPAPPPPAVPVSDGWIPLFNGKDLSGWRTISGSPRVENGAIVLEAGAEIDQKLPAADFELGGSMWFVAHLHPQVVGLNLRRPAGSRSHPNLLIHHDGDAHLRDLNDAVVRSGNGKVPMRTWFPFVLRARGSQVEFEVRGRVEVRGATPRVEAGFFAFYSSTGPEGSRLDLRDLAWRPLRP